jgi:hypothetical protein
MFMPFAFLLLLVTVPLAGGRLTRLSELRLEGVRLIVLALGLQVLMASVLPLVLPDAPHALLIGLHGASYAVIAWTLWLNRAVPGLLLIALGGGTNAAVIALNGGTLPADPDALAEAGFPVEPDEYKNSGVVDDPVLAWLGDVMATPSFLPFRNVISLGDIVVLVGGAVLLHVVCASRLGRGRQAARGNAPQADLRLVRPSGGE